MTLTNRKKVTEGEKFEYFQQLKSGAFTLETSLRALEIILDDEF
ncbi:hypothetical protein T11_13122 [Trichinella zimbabwensis]|uniref:Uncharacterized protein n=1 Tax=Trichinella zimbabwensis TaxID=268475 RepID=A0A0V1GGA4_9BILA|nr:hypothetical protein T11_13122 [Trichinella zimbabwensis]